MLDGDIADFGFFIILTIAVTGLNGGNVAQFVHVVMSFAFFLVNACVEDVAVGVGMCADDDGRFEVSQAFVEDEPVVGVGTVRICASDAVLIDGVSVSEFGDFRELA